MRHLSSTKIVKILSVLITSLFFVTSAYAHDASMHKKKNAEKPKCEAMNNTDHSKMDMNDPIMQAMMQQCMGDKSNSQEKEETDDKHNSTTEKQ